MYTCSSHGDLGPTQCQRDTAAKCSSIREALFKAAQTRQPLTGPPLGSHHMLQVGPVSTEQNGEMSFMKITLDGCPLSLNITMELVNVTSVLANKCAYSESVEILV